MVRKEEEKEIACLIALTDAEFRLAYATRHLPPHLSERAKLIIKKIKNLKERIV